MEAYFVSTIETLIVRILDYKNFITMKSIELELDDYKGDIYVSTYNETEEDEDFIHQLAEVGDYNIDSQYSVTAQFVAPDEEDGIFSWSDLTSVREDVEEIARGLGYSVEWV